MPESADVLGAAAFGLIEVAAIGAALLAAAAEVLHARRTARLARLAFGPGAKPAAWARLAPAVRVASIAALAWGLGTLLTLRPKAHVAAELPDALRKHLVIVLDVSPSMQLKDAGPNGDVPRRKRAAELTESFLGRVPTELFRTSVVACYNGAKPVVVDTRDLDVVRNVFDGLPLHYAFPTGPTDLFAGLREAFKVAQPWRPRSALLLVLTDGDTVPAAGMPKPPASIGDVLVVGVGDPRTGTFIDGRMSRQDAPTLRQVAARLNGTYHDGNAKHVPTDLIAALSSIPRDERFAALSRREYALIACGLGASGLAFLPVLLHAFGVRVRAGTSPKAAYRRAQETVKV